ncbi:hypothetical protein FBEOM_9904 [Fusarium beomiforme]|uniref:Uncharacterized protein n=1 Tax=Fusarium beomiforme TaxID=44412 RepID=A0A9P5ADG9_9HYPO|nr:hypothetical protein FBEOM_9904 [Fusarium beomiforme]
MKDFPKECKGDKPFKTFFSEGWLNVDICAEGSYDAVAWNTSRHKQEHNETLWWSMKWDIPEDDSGYRNYRNNHSYILKCESVSRRGWFELSNDANGGKPGPLHTERASWRELKYDYNDYYIDRPGWDNKFPGDRYPAAEISEEALTEHDDRPSYISGVPTVPGPLMTVALTMFGNSSFFHAVKVADSDTYNHTIDNLCESSAFPLLGLMPYNYDIEDFCSNSVKYRDNTPKMQDLIYRYFRSLQEEEATAQALEKAMFFANKALLTTTASLFLSRPIFYNPGTTVMKPKKDLGAVIAVTAMIGLQVVGLCALMWFIMRTPTWTATLNADALAHIGAQLKEWGEPRPELTKINGVVGVDETRHDGEASSGQGAALQSRSIHLTLGGEGVINRGMMKRMQANTTTVVQA